MTERDAAGRTRLDRLRAGVTGDAPVRPTVAALARIVAELQAEVAELRAEVAELRGRLAAGDPYACRERDASETEDHRGGDPTGRVVLTAQCCGAVAETTLPASDGVALPVHAADCALAAVVDTEGRQRMAWPLPDREDRDAGPPS